MSAEIITLIIILCCSIEVFLSIVIYPTSKSSVLVIDNVQYNNRQCSHIDRTLSCVHTQRALKY